MNLRLLCCVACVMGLPMPNYYRDYYQKYKGLLQVDNRVLTYYFTLLKARQLLHNPIKKLSGTHFDEMI
jgi:hypothetical protein